MFPSSMLVQVKHFLFLVEQFCIIFLLASLRSDHRVQGHHLISTAQQVFQHSQGIGTLVATPHS